MRIVIVGASGFIGSQLINRLLENKYDVYAHYRRSMPKAKAGFFPFSDYHSLEIKEPIDVVINLAGEPIASLWTKAYKKKLLDSRVQTTIKLNDWLKQLDKPPKLVIAASAIGYYGTNCDGGFNEQAPSDPNHSFSSDLCLQWEKASLAIENTVARIAIMRLGVVLGRSGGMLSKLWWSYYLGLGAVIGQGNQVLSWIHIDDVLSIVEYIIEQEDLKGPINVTAPHPVSQRDFAKELAVAMKRPLWLKLPSFFFKLLLGEMAEELLLSGAAVYPKHLENSGFVFKYPRLAIALKNLVA